MTSHDDRAPAPSTFAVVFGPSASGKTTIGQGLARALGWSFVDADDLHPPANRERMQSGVPLEDEHRWPWLDAVHDALRSFARRGENAVLACSALKRVYRERIRGDLPNVVFFELVVPREVLAERITHRKGHFFPASLLDSQLATIEHGGAHQVDGQQPPAAIVDEIAARLRG